MIDGGVGFFPHRRPETQSQEVMQAPRDDRHKIDVQSCHQCHQNRIRIKERSTVQQSTKRSDADSGIIKKGKNVFLIFEEMCSRAIFEPKYPSAKYSSYRYLLKHEWSAIRALVSKLRSAHMTSSGRRILASGIAGVHPEALAEGHTSERSLVFTNCLESWNYSVFGS